MARLKGSYSFSCSGWGYFFSTWKVRSRWVLSEYQIKKMLCLGTCFLNAMEKTQLAWDQVAQEFHKKAKEIPGMLALRTVLLPEV